MAKYLKNIIKNNNIPEKIRIGAPYTDGNLISLNLRIYKNSGKTEGELVIIKKKDGLLIKGFKGDLSLIETAKKDTKYEPEIYDFN